MHFFILGQIWAVRAELRIAAILLRYSDFEFFSSYFHGQNKYKNKLPVLAVGTPNKNRGSKNRLN